MNKRMLLLVASILLLVGGTLAQSKPKQTKMTAEELAKAVSKAFKANRLGQLEDSHPYVKRIQIITEDSLGEEPERHIQTVKNMKQLGRFFRGSENLNAGPLKKCGKGICTYDIIGMNHNSLHLQAITYGYKNGSAYIKTISILSGN